MKLRLLAFTGLAVSFVVPALAQGKVGTCTGPQDACQEIAAIAQKYMDAFNRSDAAAVAALFTKDAVQVPEGPVLSGREAIHAALTDTFKGGGWSKFEASQDQVHVMGDVAWIVGHSSAMGPGPNHTTQPYRFNWGDVVVRDDGTWKIRMETYNVIETPPQQNNAAASTNR